jgi:hypothetical protein
VKSIALIGAFALMLAALTLSTGSAAGTALPTRLTAQGRLLLNFEALLRATFDGRSVYVSDGANFSCAGSCAPASKFAPYRFVFQGRASSSFHLLSRRFRDGAFGNYPVPLLIRSKAIACDGSGRQFLVRYRNAASFTLGCLAPIH